MCSDDNVCGPESVAVQEFSNCGKRLGLFVLTYNAEKLIRETLSRIPKCVWREVEVVYVVDDCSMDDTTREVVSLGEDYGEKLKIFRNRVNRRYGGNQKFGYQYAIDMGLDAVVMLHGDGQYAPEFLPAMFKPLVEDDADVVIGSRMLNRSDALRGGMPKYKYAANIFLTGVENFIGGMRLSEFHSGYRGYSTRFLRRIPLWKNSNEWHFDSQILFQARQAKSKIVELPIPTHYGDEVCHVNGVAYGLNCIASVLMYRLHCMRLVFLSKYDLRPEKVTDRRKFDDPYSSHTIILDRLRKMNLEGAKVLDLGFGCAAVASKLKIEGAVVDGVDISAKAAEENRDIFRNVYVADLNELDSIGITGRYDIVLCADVVQYLVKPSEFLSRLKKYLVKGGILVISVPNVVYLWTRLQMLFGIFSPHHRGIIEEGALHFYTDAEFSCLLRRTGWDLECRQVSSMPVFLVFPFMKAAIFKPVVWMGRLVTVLMKGLFGYQNIYFCKNPNESELL